MSIMVLTDRTEYPLNPAEAQKVQQALARSADGFLQVAGITVKKSQIAVIKPGGPSQVDIFRKPDPAEQQLEAGNKCMGSRSINLAVINEAKKVGDKKGPHNPEGLKAFKLIGDKDWRANAKARLLKADPDGYCDQEHGKCVCYPAEVTA